MMRYIFLILLLGCNKSESETDTSSDTDSVSESYHVESGFFITEDSRCDFVVGWSLNVYAEVVAGVEGRDVSNIEPLYVEIKNQEEDWHEVGFNHLTDDIVYVFCNRGDEAHLFFRADY